MAITQAVCNSFKKEILEGVHDLENGGDVFKLALSKSTATINAATTAYITGGEVSASGAYAAKGGTLASQQTSLATGGVARTQTSSVSFESTATNIMTFNAASYRSAELMITITDSANSEYSVMKSLVLHNGSTAFGTVYGVTNSGSSDLATITFNHDGSNTVEVKATSTGGSSSALVQYSLQAV